MAEINLLDTYPKENRDVEGRFKQITEEHHKIARQFGEEFFEGDRLVGYGGYIYDGRWASVVKRFKNHYGLTSESSVLDIGCAKGFMLHDFQRIIPGIKVAGIDISAYAIANAKESVKAFARVGNAKELPFPDKSFDLVVSITTLHNLPIKECKQAIREVQRVSRKHAFITLDSWRNEYECERMIKWNLTALTYMSVEDWKKLFTEVGYTGDYYWFIP
ncbi:MAG: class I SAM-dependent methyltransferase [Patescibacteria group bacterium]